MRPGPPPATGHAAFEGLPEYIARLHRRLDEMEARLAALPEPGLASLTRWLAGLAESLSSCSATLSRTDELQAELSRVRAGNDELRRRLQRLQDALTARGPRR